MSLHNVTVEAHLGEAPTDQDAFADLMVATLEHLERRSLVTGAALSGRAGELVTMTADVDADTLEAATIIGQDALGAALVAAGLADSWAREGARIAQLAIAGD